MIRIGLANLLRVSLVLVLGAWSCSGRETAERADSTGTGHDSDEGTISESVATPAASNDSTAHLDTTRSAPSDTTGPVSGTLAELRSRLRSEALRLNRAVAAGRLTEVGARALKIRDLAVALGGKTVGAPVQKAQEIDAQVAAVTQATEKIRALAAAGETDGVKAQNSEIQGLVASILKLSAP